eukprot:CAMPEP_0182466694 /NCGR_PEP_ID=MMETSP1319-20130603/12515_1 /TAXON_ID=172717 /ORGANISM="Bolidomonas pacifica, Strain RCC208" /LENGTH=206 /DNA_ID=CAMNT_0024666721 /DNA_START=140 /DNA_END=757 /DNA_ORIENTATION=+
MPLAADSDSTVSPSSYGYDAILALAASAGEAECGTAAFSEATPYIVEVTLTNAADDKNGLLSLRSFWSLPENFSLGRLAEWPLGVSGLVPPSKVDRSKWQSVASKMWAVDQLPSRVGHLSSMLSGESPGGGVGPTVVLVHCNAGCDRTGEMVGALRLATAAADPKGMYVADTDECGRSPNYYSTTSLEWFCIWNFYFNGGRYGVDE